MLACGRAHGRAYGHVCLVERTHVVVDVSRSSSRSWVFWCEISEIEMPCPNGRTMRWRRRVVYRVARVRIHVPTLCYATMTYAMCRSGRVWGIGPGTVRSLVVKRGSAGTDSDTSPSRSTASQINSPSAKWPPRAPRGLPETAIVPAVAVPVWFLLPSLSQGSYTGYSTCLRPSP